MSEIKRPLRSSSATGTIHELKLKTVFPLLSRRLNLLDDAIEMVNVTHSFKQAAAVDRDGAVLRRIVAVVAAQRKNVPVEKQANDVSVLVDHRTSGVAACRIVRGR